MLPLILAVAMFVLLFFNYPWQTLSAGVVAYLIFLPLSARAYAKRAAIEEAKILEQKAEVAEAGLPADSESKPPGPAPDSPSPACAPST